MKRGILLLIFALTPVLLDIGHSRAAATSVNGLCFASPYNTLVPCSTATPVSRSLITPNKVLSVSGPRPAPLQTTSYSVSITSQVACFALDEPIHLYALGGNGAAVLSPLQPLGLPSPSPQSVVVRVDPKTATASLSLEVLNSALGPGGLVLKAVWPEEGVERLVQLVAPVAPTPTPTPAPGTAIATPVTSPTPTATSANSNSATAAVVTPTDVPSLPPFFVRTCVSPNPTQAKSTPTIYVQTLPGAVCNVAVTYSNGSRPKAFSSGPQTALADGFAVFSFVQSTSALAGTVTANCSFNGSSLTARSNFAVQQPVTPTPRP